MLPRVLLTNGATQVLLRVITLFQVIIVVGPGNSALLLRVDGGNNLRDGGPLSCGGSGSTVLHRCNFYVRKCRGLICLLLI